MKKNKLTTNITTNKSEQVKNTYYAGIFLVALSTLLLEFTLTRVLSVSLWYNFAFMIISVALLGFGISGVLLSVSKKLQTIPADKLLTILSMIYGISVIISFIIINKIPFDPFSLLSQSVQLLYLPVFYVLITIPFLFAGLIISVILTRFKKSVSKLYFADLLGAGLSVFVFIFLMPLFGGNGTIVFVSVLGLFAAVIFSFANHKVLSIISFVLIAVSLSFLISKDEQLPIGVSPNKQFVNLMSERPDLVLLSEWNSFSKVDVLIDEDEPADGYKLYIAVIDAGNATTNIPNVKTLPPAIKPADASNLAFANSDTVNNVFIIGSAGGGEILTSLYYGAKKVVGVEINGILNKLISSTLSYWTGPLIKNNPKVEIITDDARSVINRKDTKYDVIISAHTISASAVSSGAMSMVENYILTKEAVSEYLNKLTNGGTIYISRPETQLPKLITTLRTVDEELYGKDSEFSKKISVFRRQHRENTLESSKTYLAGVVYRNTPMSEIERMKIRYEGNLLGLENLYDYDNLPQTESVYKTLAETTDLQSEINKSNFNIAPATDDKPFFDNNIGFGNLTFQNMSEVFSQNELAIMALKDKPVSETTLIALLIQIFIIAGIFLLMPFVFMKSKIESGADKKFLLYFALLGLGYIMLQISMMQKFTMFLGQPVYTMLTVISTMLVASGFGSYFSSGFLIGRKKRNVIIFGIIFAMALFIAFIAPPVFYSAAKFELPVRILISVILIFPLGFFLGMPFPIGISTIREEYKNFTALSWSINGFFSVTGTVVAMMLGMITGFKIVFVLSALLYLSAYLVFIKIEKNI